jgi:hypothetical protein
MTSGGSTLDDVRHALYAGPRATFVERRKELAGEARRGGDRDAAKLIGEMRKPTAAAHVVNLLAHTDDASLQDLVELGASIRRAMAEGDDPEVRALLQGRAAALSKTVAQVRKIARANGEPVSGAVGDQIAQTLRAAMASDDAAAAVRDGTLAEALDEPGFGGFSIESAARAPSPKPSPKSSGRGKSQPKAEPAVDRAAEEGAAEEAAARAAARARIKSAAADVKRVEKALAATTKRRDVLGRDRDRLASQLAQVDDELAAARAEVDDLEAQLGDAAAELEAAGGSPTS